MAGKFQLKKASNGEFHFNLLAGNGQVILQSELYKAKPSALNGIESVRKNAPDDAHYERKSASNGKAYFVLKASNGQIVGQSQMYASESGRDNGIASVKTNAPDAALDDLTG
jgi:uncharacterized protein YegP (UPF0339 family)